MMLHMYWCFMLDCANKDNLYSFESNLPNANNFKPLDTSYIFFST